MTTPWWEDLEPEVWNALLSEAWAGTASAGWSRDASQARLIELRELVFAFASSPESAQEMHRGAVEALDGLDLEATAIAVVDTRKALAAKLAAVKRLLESLSIYSRTMSQPQGFCEEALILRVGMARNAGAGLSGHALATAGSDPLRTAVSDAGVAAVAEIATEQEALLAAAHARLSKPGRSSGAPLRPFVRKLAAVWESGTGRRATLTRREEDDGGPEGGQQRTSGDFASFCRLCLSCHADPNLAWPAALEAALRGVVEKEKASKPHNAPS